jgi:hypothetical protein
VSGFAEALPALDTRIRVAETRSYGIGPGRARLDFACPRLLAALSPALEHLRVDAVERPGLTVLVASGMEQSPPAALIQAETFLELPDSAAPRLRARYEEREGCFFALDHERNQGWYWQRDAATLSPHHRAAPLRALLNWWLAGQGALSVHAACVGTSQGGVLVAGPGGSGKSTLAAACLLDGMRLLGDDYVAVAAREQPRAYSLTGTLKLVPEHASRMFSTFASTAEPDRTPGDKAVYLIRARFADSLVTSLPLRAVLASRVVPDAASAIAPLARAGALRALMPSTLALFPGGYPEAVARLSALVRALPAFEVRVGKDLEALPRRLRSLIAELA